MPGASKKWRRLYDPSVVSVKKAIADLPRTEYKPKENLHLKHDASRSIPSLVTVECLTGRVGYRISAEHSEREATAQEALRRKSMQVGIAFNKGPMVFIGDNEQAIRDMGKK